MSTNNTYSNGRRNVVDYMAYWKNEAIRAHLDTKRYNFSVLIHNEYKDHNVGAIVRSCNAFLAKNIIIYGRRSFNRRPCVGTYIYENFKYVADKSQLSLLISYLQLEHKNVRLIAIDTFVHATSIEKFKWDKNTHYIMMFGHEGEGLPQELIDFADDFVYIKQYGSCRSLNVSVAAGIIMNDYCVKTNAI
jgi:tRNA G18 (ribose-2'-O)-methylase SpoU